MKTEPVIRAILAFLLVLAMVTGCAGQGGAKRSESNTSVKQTESGPGSKRPEPGSRTR